MHQPTSSLGRKPNLSAEAIIEAGLRIEARGERVNPYRIRAELGGGNSNRIRDLWEAYDEKRLADAETDPLPPDMLDKSNSMAAEVSARTKETLETIFRQIYRDCRQCLRAECDGRIAELTDTLEAAQADVERTEAALATAESDLAAIAADRERLYAEIGRLREVAAHAEADAARAREDARQAQAEALAKVTAAEREAGAASARAATLEESLARLTRHATDGPVGGGKAARGNPA